VFLREYEDDEGKEVAINVQAYLSDLIIAVGILVNGGKFSNLALFSLLGLLDDGDVACRDAVKHLMRLEAPDILMQEYVLTLHRPLSVMFNLRGEVSINSREAKYPWSFRVSEQVTVGQIKGYVEYLTSNAEEDKG
jgi:hypothetical protein